MAPIYHDPYVCRSLNCHNSARPTSPFCEMCEQELERLALQARPAKSPSANERQVGGDHYRAAAKGGKQHWDEAWEEYREAWFVLNITKYVKRYRRKGGIEDLKKARHYLDKLIELEEQDAKKEAQDWADLEHEVSQGVAIGCSHDWAPHRTALGYVTCKICNSVSPVDEAR